MGANTSFFIEIYATPKTSPPLSVDMQVFVVGKGFNISAFGSGNLSNEAWRDHPDVELVGTISQNSSFHHTHSANSSHFLIGFSTNSSGKVGNKGLDISGDFWVILTTGHQLQNRGWDLKYHAGCNNSGTWYKGSGTTFTLQSGCPDAHVHFARELPLQPYNGMNVSVVVGYEEGGTGYIFNGDPEPFYFSELPNLPPNPSAFTAPAPGIYQGNVTISWLPANDPNRDPVTYKVYLINESATEYLIANGITNTSLVLNTSVYADGFYNIRVEACESGTVDGFCTSFNLLSNFDEGLCEFFRIWNGDPEDGGIGTTGNPYLICDVCDLQNMKLNLSAHYALNNSINASATSVWNGGSGFLPIGNSTDPFTGSFDGRGYTITGLFINRSTNYIGLFGFIDAGSSVSNVSLVNADITGHQYVGGLAGTNYGSVLNCSATGKVNGFEIVGGLVGYSYSGSVSNSYSTVNVSGNTDAVGGLLGLKDSGTVNNSYSMGNVSGNSNVGGFVGKNNGGSVTNSYSTGKVSGNSNFGGLVGNNSGTVNNCFYDTDTSGRSDDDGRGVPKSTSDMKKLATFTGASWDIEGNREHDLNNGYPFLSWQVPGNSPVWYISQVCTFCGGGGSEGDPYLIGDVVCLQNMSANLSAHYALNNSIGASETSTWNSGAGFEPVGNNSTPFLGSFNGSGYTITGLFINRSTTNYVGLFGYMNTGSAVSNVSLVSVNISGSWLVGGLVGLSCGTVSNCSAAGNVSGAESVGGLMGYNMGTVSNSSAAANVSGTYMITGGLVGWNDASNEYGSISNCSAAGNVNGVGSVGGLAGENQGQISNSYARGNTSGSDCVGGLVGSNDTGDGITGTIDNSYSTGNVSGGSNIGGLVGYNTSSSVNGSFWDTETSGRATSAGGTGKNTSEMKDFSTFFTAGWDLICESDNGTADIWGLNYSGTDNNGYPFLSWQGFTHNVSFTLTYSAGINGSFIVNSPQTVGCGEDGAEVEAQPYPNYHFVNWSDSVTDNPRTDFNVFGNITVTANIVLNQSTLNTSSTAGGSVTNPGEGTYYYNYGDIVTINATPDSCYYFVNWSGDTGTIVNVNALNTTITMNGNYSIQANFAAETFSGGDGSEGNPFLIQNVCQLQNMNTNLSAHYALNGSFNASETSGWNGGAGFTPVGNNTAQFTGSLDGRDYTITGLYINRSSTDYVGLFGYINTDGAVSNVSLVNMSITGHDRVGGLAGVIQNGAVSNLSAAGTVNGTGREIGGLIGFNIYGAVSNSSAAGTVNGTGHNVGGLVGSNYYGSVSDSWATGNVSGSSFVGGLMGFNWTGGMVSNSYATGNVSGTSYIGGLVGDSQNGYVSDSHATGNVSATGDNVGGLVGYNQNTSVADSFATGNVTTTGSPAGGLIGFNFEGSTVTNCSATGSVNGTSAIGGLIGANQTNSSVSDSSAAGSVSGSQFKVGGFIGQNYDSIVSNCSASGNVSTGDIGPDSRAGGLIGDNSGIISGCSATGNVSATGDYVGGLIGNSDASSSVSNSSAAGSVSGHSSVGGLVGGKEGGTVNNSSASGNVSGQSQTGGLVGYNYGTVNNSHATGNVSVSGSGNYFGGLVGVNGDAEHIGTVINSYATGNVSGSGNYFGGLVGNNAAAGTINCSYAIGNVSATGDYAGGLVGYNYGMAANSYAVGNVSGNSDIGGLVGNNDAGTINCSYAIGNVSGSSNVGGLIGVNGGIVSSSFYDTNTSGRNDNDGRGVPKTTAEMNSFSTFYNASWDLICEITNGTDDIWGIDQSGTDNNGYPFLWWQGLTHNVSFTMNLSSTDGGNVSTPGEGTFGPYNCGQVVPIEAAPDSGYFFLYWTSNTSTIADINNPNTSVTMYGNYSIQANFTDVMYNLSTASTAGGNVTVPGEGTYSYGGGHLVTINASPDPCYYFISWTGDTGNISDVNNPNTSITMNGNYSIQANFAINISTLTYTANAGGTVNNTTPQVVTCGENGSPVLAIPNACYHFVNWSDSITDNPRTDTNVTNNITVAANFAINTSTLTYTANAGGTINGASPQIVNCGEDGSAVEAVPNACYHFVNWNDSSTQNPRTDTNVTNNITVAANFAINTSTLTYTANAGGTINGASPQVVNCSENGSAVEAVPNACYYFVNWSDSITDNPRTDTATSVNQTFSANFAIYQYTLTYTAGANGSINGTSPQTVNCGASGTAVRAVPDAGYRFFNWSDGRTVNPRTDTNVQSDITVTANFRLGGGGGGGGGSVASQVLTINVFNETSTGIIDNSGVLQQDVDAVSQDGRVSIHIPAGTAALAQDGNSLTQIDVHILDEYPEPPDGKIVVAAFDFEPDGATFNPAIQITITYDPATLPEGADESQLVIAFYNEAAGQWEYLSGTVNPDTNTITFSITHFTVFAIMAASESGAAPATTPTPTPTPEPTVEPTSTPTVSPAPTPTATPTATPAAGDKGDNRPDDWVIAVLAVVLGTLLAVFIGAVVIRARK
jgi:cell division septation protein DedD